MIKDLMALIQKTSNNTISTLEHNLAENLKLDPFPLGIFLSAAEVLRVLGRNINLDIFISELNVAFDKAAKISPTDLRNKLKVHPDNMYILEFLDIVKSYLEDALSQEEDEEGEE